MKSVAGEGHFVKMDSYAIAFPHAAFSRGVLEGNSMGLILDARGSTFFRICRMLLEHADAWSNKPDSLLFSFR